MPRKHTNHKNNKNNNDMPKERRRGPTTGGANRHAPLGQVIADDENRSKYATVRSRHRGGESSSKRSQLEDTNEDLLDEKSTQRILKLGKEQMLEIELEEQRNLDAKRRRGRGGASASAGDLDSSDEEDNGSTMGDILDEDDEE